MKDIPPIVLLSMQFLNGKYKIKIIGLRSKKVEKDEKFRKGYAFLMQLEKVDNIPNIADSTQLDFSKLFE